MDHRRLLLEQWLISSCQLRGCQLQMLQGDASFRRYFRVRHGNNTYIAMDAPPERENCRPFVTIAAVLRVQGLSAPEIFAHDLDNGFLLLTDFGDNVYLKVLNPSNADVLYGRALDALSILQTCRDTSLPLFTADFMYQELMLCQEWFLVRHLHLDLTDGKKAMLASFFQFLTASAASQPTVFMHRDYHSANLMVLEDAGVGILDFQDAFMGPVTYDLVSLLRDCYIGWPDAMVKKLVLQYKEKIAMTAVNDEQFLRWFDLMGLQRHLKALLTFARKYHRDNNANYLQHIPRAFQYVLAVSARYPEAADFHAFLNEVVVSCAL